MSDRKTATTIDEQLARLQSRGMTIGDIENAGKVLSSVGYFIYYMLRQIDPDKETEMRNMLRSLVNQVEYDSVKFAISRLAF
ncbi:MAG: hypothetical protein IJ718_01340 [Paludibacteraceae bacterium]|nr:hypothetical protein [Paludibacteraceae bacterium]